MVTDKFTHFTNKISDSQEVLREDRSDTDMADDCGEDCFRGDDCDDDCHDDCHDDDCPCPCPPKDRCPFRGISIADVMRSLEDID